MKKNAYNIKRGQAAVELAIFGSIILVAFSVLLMYGQRLDSQQQVKMEAFRRALQKAYERNGSVSYTLKKESRAANLFSGFGQGQASTVGSTASVMWQKGLSGPQGNNKGESYSYYVINDTPIGTEEEFVIDSKKGKKVKDVSLPRYPKHQPTPTGGTSTGDKFFTAYVPVSVWNEEQVRQEEYNATASKEERPGGRIITASKEERPGERIINTKTSDLKDTIQVTLHTRVDKSIKDDYWGDEPLPKYVYGSIAPVSLGAYARDDINRIDYEQLSNAEVAKTIHRERQWQTEN